MKTAFGNVQILTIQPNIETLQVIALIDVIFWLVLYKRSYNLTNECESIILRHKTLIEKSNFLGCLADAQR